LAPWLRAVTALDNDEVGDQVPVSNLLVGLILRRVIARQRNNRETQSRHAENGKSLQEPQTFVRGLIASAEFLEDWMITSDISFDRFFVFDIHSHNLVALRHLMSP
jgi:hypothetical protein